jgi:hypothetical protein
MGLGISVSVLDPRSGHDDEWRDAIRKEIQRQNRFLAAAGGKPHAEPDRLGDREPCSYEMWGYTGLSHLRRIAAHLWAGRPLPAS